ncbi:hypothetical protein ES332_D11G288900v1 [Gossypium tomentosum]|uniref:Protein kinase domain-containing protein n=1 Tax=Gossypium tomentosum TaxID=34277 RepID=A0A5D2IUN2_GOSTO|nr:hypothetical protein ES332_D11G288900v1 [Gossypium tomentosum]
MRMKRNKLKKQLHKHVKSKHNYNWCSSLQSYSKGEIENAINFSRKRKSLGKGITSEVYQGILPSGQLVAIKQINRSNSPHSFKSKFAVLVRLIEVKLALG